MIYPRTLIAKRWYRISTPDENVLEIYNGKPLGVETSCEGFDMRDILTKDGIEYYNPKYGERLADNDLRKVFPSITIGYYTYKTVDGVKVYKQQVDGKYVDPVTGKDSDSPSHVVYLKRVDGEPNTSVGYVVGHNPKFEYDDSTSSLPENNFTQMLWLDNMVKEGDRVVSAGRVYNGIPASLTPPVDIVAFKNMDVTVAEEPDADVYGKLFVNGLLETLVNGMDGGLTFSEAYKRLPWYVTGSRYNEDGSVDEVVGSIVLSPKGGTGSSFDLLSLFSLTPEGKPNKVLAGYICDILNEKANDCVDSLYDKLVKDAGLSDVIEVSDDVTPFHKAGEETYNMSNVWNDSEITFEEEFPPEPDNGSEPESGNGGDNTDPALDEPNNGDAPNGGEDNTSGSDNASESETEPNEGVAEDNNP